MKRKIINLILEEFLESSIRKSMQGVKSGTLISLSINSSFYEFQLTDKLDAELYNNYDFVLLEKGLYTFSINRDYISFFLELTKEYSLILVAIIPLLVDSNSGSPGLREELFLHSSEDTPINFLTLDYIPHKNNIGSFNNLSIKIRCFIFLIIILFFSINLYSYVLYRKSLVLKNKIALSENRIHKLEGDIIVASSNLPTDLSFILSNSRIKISQLLEKINDSSNPGIFFKKIEYQVTTITIYGSARTLNDFLLFEDALKKNGISQLNNDYVRRVDNFYDFTIDGIIVGD